jgi:hypothetical protein
VLFFPFALIGEGASGKALSGKKSGKEMRPV